MPGSEGPSSDPSKTTAPRSPTPSAPCRPPGLAVGPAPAEGGGARRACAHPAAFEAHRQRRRRRRGAAPHSAMAVREAGEGGSEGGRRGRPARTRGRVEARSVTGSREIPLSGRPRRSALASALADARLHHACEADAWRDGAPANAAGARAAGAALGAPAPPTVSCQGRLPVIIAALRAKVVSCSAVPYDMVLVAASKETHGYPLVPSAACAACCLLREWSRRCATTGTTH